MSKTDDRDEAWFQHHLMQEWGLLDPGQSTEFAHREHVQKMRKQFTPLERQQIRAALGLIPVDSR